MSMSNDVEFQDYWNQRGLGKEYLEGTLSAEQHMQAMRAKNRHPDSDWLTFDEITARDRLAARAAKARDEYMKGKENGSDRETGADNLHSASCTRQV